jgi:hypothetical protein
LLAAAAGSAALATAVEEAEAGAAEADSMRRPRDIMTGRTDGIRDTMVRENIAGSFKL